MFIKVLKMLLKTLTLVYDYFDTGFPRYFSSYLKQVECPHNTRCSRL